MKKLQRKSNNIDDEYSKSLEEINSLNNLIDNSKIIEQKIQQHQDVKLKIDWYIY